MKFSLLIPARDEEAQLGGCLDAVAEAARPYAGDFEIVVALNRCQDRTEAIALSRGARVVREDAKCLSTVRNAAARAARGEILVTLDADSRPTRNLFMEIDRALTDPRQVGGAVWVQPERISAGIAATGLLLLVYFLARGIGCGCFWCRREDFWAIGGFDENLLSAEDIDFARRLKSHGHSSGRRFGLLWRAYIRTSCRTFDRFGDWYFFRQPRLFWRLLQGRDRAGADRFWYDCAR